MTAKQEVLKLKYTRWTAKNIKYIIKFILEIAISKAKNLIFAF